jgi:hypothetical protein
VITDNQRRTLRLRDYLASLHRRPVVWGESDCCRFMAGWLERCGVMVDAPAYASQAEARRLIAAAGGLGPLIGQIAACAGLQPTGAPGHGDVALVEMSAGLVGGIVLHGGYVALRTDTSIVWLLPRALPFAWRVPEPV